MRPLQLLLFAATRPNLIKIAAIYRAAQSMAAVQVRWVFATQHRDPALSADFFPLLDLPAPHAWLEVPAGLSREALIAAVRQQMGALLQRERPDWLLAPGDVNASVGAALAAADTRTPLAHVEAGLRSFDLQMPEEHNRRQIDHLSDLLFATEPAAVQNLLQEGVAAKKIKFPGNVMIDTLRQVLPAARRTALLPERPFFLCTFHRPSNVDSHEGLLRIGAVLQALCARARVLLPLHPRTQERLHYFGLKNDWQALPNLYLCPPLDYRAFVAHLAAATLVLTDSGGIQEETTALQIPCVTFRPNTERPVTVTRGTNVLLADLNADTAGALADAALAGVWKTSEIPEGWDGQAARRLLDELVAASR